MIRRTLMAVVVSLIAGISFAQAPAVLPRQDFQCLNQTKKDQFISALKVLASRSPANDSWDHPYDNSLTFYQLLHNGPGSGGAYCTHRSEAFLTWHRALLVIFERALQKAANDPDLRLPYWNWVRKPTGKHYPIEFETDPFLIARRDNSQPETTRYTEAEVEETIRDNKTWVTFAGPAVGYGALEKDRHNGMHTWVGGRSGGFMTSDTTAAKDPLFWVFHNYLDLVFDDWQRRYSYPKVPNPDRELNKLPGWTAGLVERTENLGYTYDRKSCGSAPALKAAAAFALADSPELLPIKTAGGTGVRPFTFDIAIPQPGFDSAEIHLQGSPFPEDFSYDASLYLYPSGRELDTEDAAFVQKYRVDSFDVWAHREDPEHAGHDMHGELYIDATTELAYLAKTAPGSHWKVAVVVERIYGIDGSAASNVTKKKESIHFDAASIELNRGVEQP
jgi:tyrosinase